MPTPTLNLCSPYEKLFGSSPNYSKLKVFGCLCYPWLRPYTSHKLDPRSKPCVFFGYSLTQSAYLCYDPSTLKVFVSRHVKFVESIYPFSSTCSQDARPDSSTVTTWIPQPIPIRSITPALISPSAGCPQQHHHSEGPSVPSPASDSSVINTSHAPTQSSSISLTDDQLPAPRPNHPMQTRAKNNIHKPLHKLNLNTMLSTHSDLEPTTSAQALKDPIPNGVKPCQKNSMLLFRMALGNLFLPAPTRMLWAANGFIALKDILMDLLTGTRLDW